MYLKFGLSIILFVVLEDSTLWSQDDATKGGPDGSSQRFDFEFPAMGTLVQITAYGQREVLEPTCQRAKHRIQELAAVLTDYEPHSETRQLSQLAFQRPHPVSEPLWSVLDAADRWHELSQGALDCSVGQLTVMWRKYRRAGRLPKANDVLDALSHTGWDKVKLNRDNRTITHQDQLIRLDFGAIGKGFIADEAFKIMLAGDVPSCLVNIAGNMRCGQPPPGKSGWNIAISSPRSDDTPLDSQTQATGALTGSVLISNQAIATSGDLYQYTMIDGVKRSHILDPRTGYGVVGPVAVTVIAPNAMDADALATIGCIQDWESFCKLTESQQNCAALKVSWIDGQLRIDGSQSFPEISRPD